MSAVHRVLAAALVISLLPCIGRAQGSPWFGEDALVLSRGMVRLGIAPTWTRFDERYRVDGESEPLATDLSTQSLDQTRLSVLGPVRERLEALGPTPDIAVTLGRLRVDHDASIFRVPIAAEMGIGTRLSLGIMLPIVRALSAVALIPNPSVNEGNIGINPALNNPNARAQNQALLAQFANAVGALQALIAACADLSNPDPRCPQARTPEARQLADNASAFAGGLGELYSGTESVFVPVNNSPFDTTIRGRIASFAESFADFDINAITSSGPAAAAVAGYADIQRILSDPAFGLRARPLTNRTTTSIGDIEIGAMLQVLNTVRRDSLQRLGSGVRAAVGATFRLGSGRADDPDHFTDIPSGDGQHDVELRTQWDLRLGSSLALGFGGRYVVQLADRETVRITESDQPFAAYWRRQDVERDLGDIIDVQVTPRAAFGSFFSVMAQYRARRKGEDRHTGRFNVNDDFGEPVTLDAAILDEETEQREDRVSIGLGYSTLSSVSRNRARIPLEIFLQYGESIRGSGGKTPKVSVGVMQVRVYF